MTPAGAARLLDLLAARAGLVCAVGAGGKKSTLYRLAEAQEPGFRKPPPTTWIYSKGVLQVKAPAPRRRGQ